MTTSCRSTSEYLRSTRTRRLDDVIEENLANQGIGLEVRAVETTKVGGTDSRINIPATYVELLDKKSGDSLGRYLVSQIHSDRETLMGGVGPDASNIFDQISMGDDQYNIGLQYHREVKPYWIQLEDVRGSTTAGPIRRETTRRSFASSIPSRAKIARNAFG